MTLKPNLTQKWKFLLFLLAPLLLHHVWNTFFGGGGGVLPSFKRFPLPLCLPWWSDLTPPTCNLLRHVKGPRRLWVYSQGTAHLAHAQWGGWLWSCKVLQPNSHNRYAGAGDPRRLVKNQPGWGRRWVPGQLAAVFVAGDFSFSEIGLKLLQVYNNKYTTI